MVLLPANEHQEVRDAFVQWVSLQTAAPPRAESLIMHIETAQEYAGALEADILGRHVVWKDVPAPSRSRASLTPIAIGDVDAWSADPSSLRRRSDHVAVCHTCKGEKKVRCASCAGAGRMMCGACNGQRKSYGYASNGAYRLLNCGACRGRGDIDCVHCRRGLTVCAACAGEGRVQRWMDVESWHRSSSRAHPLLLAQLFGWDASPTNDAIARDGELLRDLDRPYPLTSDDLSGVPSEWIDVLRTEITSDEHVTRQRLRIARIPAYSVLYRLGGDEDLVTFYGLRLLASYPAATTPFDQRAKRLRTLRRLLIGIAIAIAVTSLARNAFFRSVPTLLSLVACSAAFIAIDAAAADWTAARQHTRIRVIFAIFSLIVAIIFAIAALPRVSHAQQLIVSGRLDDAESELRLLQHNVPPSTWADLHLARVRTAADVDAARKELAQIPPALPQYASAVNTAGPLFLKSARGQIDRAQWREAAETIAEARRIGVAAAKLEPLAGAIRAAAISAAADATKIDEPRRRLRQRLAAEEIFVSWERAGRQSGSPALIALRSAIAKDIAAIERKHGRGKH